MRFSSLISAVTVSFALSSSILPAHAADSFERARAAILGMGGCYLVDYSFTETQALKPGYSLDRRVYDVNRDKSIKELILPVEVSPTHIRLQHILFGVDLNGKIMEGSFLRHQAEDWEYQPASYYEFMRPGQWEGRKVPAASGAWVRRITNLDDGLRYQCLASWDTSKAFPEWQCANYAPIPGRETRDMGRKDYNTLQRNTRIVSYGLNWLERQDNVKTIDQNGSKTPLASEVGKTWYARLHDEDCQAVEAWANPRLAFWNLLRETWAEKLTGDGPFHEKSAVDGLPRYARVGEVEDKYFPVIERDPALRAKAKQEILDIIELYRAP